MLWLPSKRWEQGLKDMDGGQAPGGTWTSQDGGTVSALTAPTAAQVFHRVQLAFRSSQLNTAGPLFSIFWHKTLFNVRLFWNVWYFIKYLKSTKGRQKNIPHCNIYILRAWSPGSGLNHGAWEWKRQRGNIRDRRVINRKKTHLPFGWLKNSLWATFFSHTIYLLVTALFPMIPCVIQHEASGVLW